MANDHNIHALPAEIVRPEDPLVISERVAVTAFLAGYSGGTRVSYTTDLRIFAEWCHGRELNLLNVKRAHLELFARWMEQEGRMPSTIGRRLSTLSSFYKYCQIEDIVIKNPAANICRPRVNDESRTLGLDRNELGALLVQAGLGDLRDGALITLLALNGLRISEARHLHRLDVHRRSHSTRLTGAHRHCERYRAIGSLVAPVLQRVQRRSALRLSSGVLGSGRPIRCADCGRLTAVSRAADMAHFADGTASEPRPCSLRPRAMLSRQSNRF